MSKQQSVKAFFKSDESKSPPTKKKKISADETCEEERATEDKTVEAASSLSPEQKHRIEDNRAAAQLKLLSKQTSDLVQNVGASWLPALEKEFKKEYFAELGKFVAAQRKSGTVHPPAHQVFSWTQLCAMEDIKVVILGQDPYHGPGQAHGLCFSVQTGVPPPPSLVNMFKELETDIKGFKRPKHGNLTGWAKQGVLLLNACLTVRQHEANSHAGKGWEKLTDAVVQWLNENTTGTVFMLWGKPAQKKGAKIDKKRHHVLTCAHPSPLSASRGFFNCKHFSKANELLRDQNRDEIDWSNLPCDDN